MMVSIEPEVVGHLLERYVKQTITRRLTDDYHLYPDTEDAWLNVYEILPTIEKLINKRIKEPDVPLVIPNHLYEDLTLKLIDSLIKSISFGFSLTFVIFLANEGNLGGVGFSKSMQGLNNLILEVDNGNSERF